ncbi:unnamed protein product [Cladocopium goreaui]|uniref:Uncharacterized protein n=1 Tax=Cladocopium goreaui TaxID=2562237 RepID=A0A9P1FXX2_9DINO|nr:unnamed protein product [Cladocopium goreaui]
MADSARVRSKRRMDAHSLGAAQVPRGPVLDNDNFSQMLQDAFIRNAEPMSVVMPWEKGVAKTIFSKGPNVLKVQKQQLRSWVQATDNLSEDAIAAGPTMVGAPSATLSGALFEKALSVVTDQNFLEKRQEDLDLAVDKWFSIIRINLLGSEVGQTIIGHGGNIQEQKLGAYETIEAIIGVRSRTTAISRANALLNFFRWRADFTEDDGKPVTEQSAWSYVAKLRADGVVALHSLMENKAANFIDRALAAYALLALYGRCRHSDLAFVDCVMHDFDWKGGFVEVSTRLHKTAKSATQKSQLLPIVIPAIGVTGQVWVQEAIEAFSACGLNLDGSIQGPLFRPPMAAGGGLCKRGLTSSEVTKFLGLLFECNDNNVGGPRVSSHSLKATALSWASKFGLPIPDKAILGRHASATTEAHAIYSRDLSVASVMKLQDIILRISRLEFQPDNPRRGYFAEENAPCAEPDAIELVKVEEDSPAQEGVENEKEMDKETISDHQSSSGSSSEESSSSDEEVRPPPPKCYRHTAKDHLAGRFVSHKTSKLVHYKDSVVGESKAVGKAVLSCGRVLNSNYDIVVHVDTDSVNAPDSTSIKKVPNAEREKTEVQDMVVSSALQVQESLQRRGLALVFADLVQHANYTRYLTTLFSHLHREPPAGYSRCSVSQIVAADKLVWQALLEEGVQPKRDDAGVLALDTKLLSTLESYRVSFSLLPLIAKKEGPGNIQKKNKPQQPWSSGKGAVATTQKPWLKQKGGKKGGKSKQRVPSHIFKLGGTASNPEGEPICFGFNSEGGCSEVFCGSARVTASLKELGLVESFGVDHDVDKAIATVKKLDLKIPGPVPLRSHELPEGLTGLRGKDRRRDLGHLPKLRADWFSKWTARAKELQPAEMEMKAGMPADIANILKPKRLLLWKEILLDLGYPDADVVSELTNGTELVGEVPTYGIFEKTFKPAETTVDSLCKEAKSIKQKHYHSCRSSGDKEIDELVWKKTQEEVELGWASGPIDIANLPADAIVSRRFGLRQPGKIRLIDDLSASNVNQTVQCAESPKPQSIDFVAALLLTLLGWKFAEEGEKATCFGDDFSALGVRLNLENANLGKVSFINTEKRITELTSAIEDISRKGRMTVLESQKLRGRMQFADGQVFGRLGKLCMKAITQHAFTGRGDKLEKPTVDALRRFVIFLNHAEPRSLELASDSVWTIYTDACYEPQRTDWVCGLGGVLVNLLGEKVAFFSMELSTEQRRALGAEFKKTIIFEAELLAMVLDVAETALQAFW